MERGAGHCFEKGATPVVCKERRGRERERESVCVCVCVCMCVHVVVCVQCPILSY